LILSGNTLYGTAHDGGTSGGGTVFAVNTDGTGFTTLYTFTGVSDGASPFAGLILSGDTLYGTTSEGGTSSDGTVFAVNTDGTGFTVLHTFTGSSDGAYPRAGLILSGNTLYGTASDGGSFENSGTVFAVNTDGAGFTTLYTFTGGGSPAAGLILSGNTLYGTTIGGGTSLYGTVFGVNTDGTGFTVLHSFTFGSDGAEPHAGLILSGNTLFGTAEDGGVSGGSGGLGTVFSLSLVPVAQDAFSRRVHGGAGTFDIPLPLTGNVGVECRSGGVTNDYQMVVTFSGIVTVNGNPQAQVTSGTGCVGTGGTCTGNVSVSGNIVTIPLTNVANAQTINVTLNSVNGSINVTIPMGVLIGDVNGNGAVNASDIALSKSRSGQPVDPTTFRSDVNADGSINASDVALVKASAGTGLP
jgi:uncharacterized repeat protein (TIGR03803 family)